MKDKATSIRPGQAQKDRDFKNVPWTARQGIENWKELFGLQIDKAALSSVRSVDNGNDKANLIFGNNRIMTRTLDHWKEMIKQASMLIDSLQKELLKARARRRAEDQETNG